MQLLILSKTDWFVSDEPFAEAGFEVARKVLSDGERPDWQSVAQADAIVLALYPPEECIALAAQLRKRSPDAIIVPYCPEPSTDFLLQMIRLSVRDVLTAEDAGSIRAILEGIYASGEGNGSSSRRPSVCIGFASAKGGDGATTIMANFAWELARVPDIRVIAIDVAQPFGDLDIFLSENRPVNDLASFSLEIGRLDDALFKTMTEHVTDQLDLIAAPPTFDRAVSVAPEHVVQIVDQLTGNYDFILIDLGSLIAPISLPLLDKLDRLILACRANMASARALSQQLHLLENLDVPADRINIIVNASSSADSISRLELAKAANKAVDQAIPEAGKIANDALGAGVPVVAKAPASAFSKAIRALVSATTGLNTKDQSLWHRLRNR